MAQIQHAAFPPQPTIADADRDALHILPLGFIPLQTPALARARMIKNSSLESVVELFSDAGTGSGQIDIENVPREFGWNAAEPHPDQIVLIKLGLLPSFDVYSLRILLRRHGIAVNEAASLKLSEAKNAELTGYMKSFTRPLIARVYGGDAIDVDRFEQLVALFQDPDGRKAIARLKMLAAKLEIPILQVPQFLEEYGDVFLSLSYYRAAFDQLSPGIEDLRRTLKEISKHHQLRQDEKIMKTCKLVYASLTGGLNNVRVRLLQFDQSTQDFWSNVSAERFRAVRRLITESHATIGGILCALTVKMDAWTQKFRLADAGGPVRRADFIVNEMRRGIEKLRHLEAAGQTLATVE